MAERSSAAEAAPLEVVILAAGQGTRMRSALPKVLHQLGGKAMLNHVLDAVEALEPDRIHVVVGRDADQIRSQIAADVSWVTQTEQLGTGHAVLQALPEVADNATVLVVYGDVPLVNSTTLQATQQAAAQGALALVTADFEIGRAHV